MTRLSVKNRVVHCKSWILCGSQQNPPVIENFGWKVVCIESEVVSDIFLPNGVTFVVYSISTVSFALVVGLVSKEAFLSRIPRSKQRSIAAQLVSAISATTHNEFFQQTKASLTFRWNDAAGGSKADSLCVFRHDVLSTAAIRDEFGRNCKREHDPGLGEIPGADADISRSGRPGQAKQKQCCKWQVQARWRQWIERQTVWQAHASVHALLAKQLCGSYCSAGCTGELSTAVGHYFPGIGPVSGLFLLQREEKRIAWILSVCVLVVWHRLCILHIWWQRLSWQGRSNFQLCTKTHLISCALITACYWTRSCCHING